MREPARLTGNTRHRLTWWHVRWVLQVEEEISVVDHGVRLSPGVDRWRRKLRWRDAGIMDYIALTRAGIAVAGRVAMRAEPRNEE